MVNSKNNKRSVMNNIWFLIKNACKWDKKILSYFGLFTIVTAILPFINIFAPKFLIDELMGANRLERLITILLSYFIIAAILSYLDSHLEGAHAPRLMHIAFKFGNLIRGKCMKMDFKYPSSERAILKNLSFKINKGQRLALVGINGAGKTTFVKLLTRLYEPTEGEILLNGVNISKFDRNEYYKLFSGGESQKLAISRALYKDAPIVVLDEPTAIYISHRLSSCKLCDRIAVFHNGEIIQHGTHEELIKEQGSQYESMYMAQAQYYV